MRLRKAIPSAPGWRRVRSGHGFRYLDENGHSLPSADVARCRALVIPPAWQQVWICPYANGHIQAIGIDARGRRQYIYHPQWRVKRDLAKHDRVLKIARRLPDARRQVEADLRRDGMPIERALATAFRLLDLGYFRIGSDTYATENGSYGLTTLERRHVHRHGKLLLFEFTAKSGISQHIEIIDPLALASVEAMRRRRGSGEQLLAYRNGSRWVGLTAGEVNEYLKGLRCRPRTFGPGTERFRPRSRWPTWMRAHRRRGSERSPRLCVKSPIIWEIPPRWLVRPTSMTGSSTATWTGRRLRQLWTGSRNCRWVMFAGPNARNAQFSV